jgi:putative PIN family toxin of toxin-antitoxin system
MRLVVLDTNVLVSAAMNSAGDPHRLVMDWVLGNRVHAVTCPEIVAEYRDVFARPKFARYGFPPQWMEYLIDRSLQLPDPPPWPHSLPDPGDAPFLALGQTSGAWLVTGNLKHFPARARHRATVLSPVDYLARLSETKPRPQS